VRAAAVPSNRFRTTGSRRPQTGAAVISFGSFAPRFVGACRRKAAPARLRRCGVTEPRPGLDHAQHGRGSARDLCETLSGASTRIGQSERTAHISWRRRVAALADFGGALHTAARRQRWLSSSAPGPLGVSAEDALGTRRGPDSHGREAGAVDVRRANFSPALGAWKQLQAPRVPGPVGLLTLAVNTFGSEPHTPASVAGARDRRPVPHVERRDVRDAP